MDKVTDFLKRAKNEVAVVAAFLTAAITLALQVTESIPPGTAGGAYVVAVVMGLLRALVSPAFPEGSDEAIRLAQRYDFLALEKLAAEGDLTAAEALERIKAASR